MTPETFDRLTRRLATGSTHSRRGLLGALAGGVAAAVVGAFGRSSPAAGQQGCGDVGQPCCNGICKSGPDGDPIARCFNGTCHLCGDQGQPCCAFDLPPELQRE